MATYTETHAHPFVAAFAQEHDTIGKQKSYLKTVAVEKLMTAFKLIEASGDRSAMSNSVSGLIEAELRRRPAEMTRQ